MNVVPVLDLMGGRVVQGRAGDRARYRPVHSSLVAGSDPVDVAAALRDATGAHALYVADIDAITGHGDHLDAVAAVAARTGAPLWVDAGAASPQTAVRLLAAGISRVVVGTETLTDVRALTEIRDAVTNRRVLLSVDVGEGGVLSACPRLRGLSPVAALDTLRAADLGRVLVLTLQRVGTAAGPDLATLTEVRRAYPHLSLVAGGGVRDVADLEALAGLGVDAVLVSTALHRGWIDAEQIAALADHQAFTSGP